MSREIQIYCPKCSWEPLPRDRWMCECSCVWNTFETGGVCPDCGKVHSSTQCLSCARFSPHSAWYHEFRGGEQAVEEEKTTLAPATAQA